MKISVFASAYRPHLWDELLTSLESNSDYEVIFCGQNYPKKEYKNFKYIHSDLKTANCYEIARRACSGEIVHWTADDAVYTTGLLDKAYEFIKQFDRKTVVSMQTKENGHFCHMPYHNFNGKNDSSPIMAPLGFMYRDYLNELGGLDKRYEYGQWENDIVMRVYQDGGQVKIYDKGDAWIELDHANKHENYTRLLEPYARSRSVLLGSWVKDGVIQSKRLDGFEPYES